MLIDKTLVIQRWAGNSEAWFDDFIAAIHDYPSILSVVAMGSSIRDRGHRRSDLDLLILYRDFRPLIRRPVEVDLRIYNAGQINEMLLNGHEIACWVMKYGISLFDPQGNWAGLQTTWSDKIPLPSAREALDRAWQSYHKASEMFQVADESAADDLLLASVTQFARYFLIQNQIFPASRPELPEQLRSIHPQFPIAQLLDDVMFNETPVENLFTNLNQCLKLVECPVIQSKAINSSLGGPG